MKDDGVNMSKVLIYHNPACGTSRNTLAMIRATGEEPEIIDYLREPPNRQRLVELIDLMLEHPILINRPIVVTEKAVRLCRPSETVLRLLDRPLPAPFTKEDGDVVQPVR